MPLRQSFESVKSRTNELNTSRSIEESQVAMQPKPTIKCEIKTLLSPANTNGNFNSSRVDIAEANHGKVKKKIKKTKKRKKRLPKFDSL